MKTFKTPFILLILTLLGFYSSITYAQVPAFPGAEGFGSKASGGRGGKVVQVTNLNDDGDGSLRWALNQFPGKPLIVTFQISGIIELKSVLKINRSDLTIAGQTAPGDGICIKGNAVELNMAKKGGNNGNVIVRCIRFRPGAPIYLGCTGLNIENTHDVIIDHCDFSWANEENIVCYNSKNVTIQWCISSESLFNAWHHKGSRAYSGAIGGQFLSFHHNLLAHHNSRAPRFSGARSNDTCALVDFRNNVVYNSHSKTAAYGGEMMINGGYSRVNMIGNYFKPGPATPGNWVFIHPSWNSACKEAGNWHLAGNKMVGKADLTADNYKGLDLSEIPDEFKIKAKSDSIFTIPGWATLKTQSADDAYQLVLANAGTILPKRDQVDDRIVNETRLGVASGTGSYPAGIKAKGKFVKDFVPSVGHGIIDTAGVVGGWPNYVSKTPLTDSDGDGIPDTWETRNGLNAKDPNDGNALSKTGYTNIENYINSLVSSPYAQQKK
ncbi:pectate lyase [Mucilaginibacter yixingensis]|uniref:Pectate lyase n=1 Tax=Mucilaginibacter yixingensis TaxID=1295612 RepID=A0A2T5JFG2_9SPHI|nr:pectate lyase [Mucilaginibacter yixingensis]PTR01145.1 pectate lyase [Mucilaginibacter yixingensis]